MKPRQVMRSEALGATGAISTEGNEAHGIQSTGDNAGITNNNTIMTSGIAAHGILAAGEAAEITLGDNGAISTEGDGANGIRSLGDTVTITSNGDIMTSGGLAYGIDSLGDDATITLGETGAISTSGNNANGIFSSGVNTTLSNDGEITTSGTDSHGISSTGTGDITNGGAITSSGQGIRSTGDVDTIMNSGMIDSGGTGIHSEGATTEITVTASGTITTSGADSHGISSTGTGDITNNGAISTEGNEATGIRSTGDNAGITNNNTIMTSGIAAHGILAAGEGTEITLGENGTITTSGGFGIRSLGDTAEITSNGDITTSGGLAYGIQAGGEGTQVTVGETGTIATEGDSATGIQSTDEAATISNNGTITTSGNNAIGIRSLGDTAEITLGDNGTITTEGRGAIGISSEGEDATVTSNGTITTSGNNAHGIQSTGEGATTEITVTASGTITTSGDDAHGIQATGDGAMITIEGKVSVSGEGSYVVHGGDDTNQILTLSAGAETQGEFNLGDSKGDNDVANVSLDTSTVISSTITIGGAETINLTNADQDARIFQLPQFKSEAGDSVAIVDPTGATATRRALGTTTGQIHRQVSNRLAFAPHGGDSAADAHDGAAWGALFGGQSKRDDDGLALAFDHSFYGVVGGYDAYSDSGQRVGFFAGFGREDIKTSDIASITDTADRLFAGFYGRHVMGNWSLDGSVVVGRASHKSTRLVDDNIKGRETARGKYNSTSISPALRLSWSQALANGLELRPSAHIAYTHGSYGSYTESGTTNSDLSFGKRTVGITDARLQLAVAQPFAADRGEIEWRIGATSTHYGKDSVNARLGEGETTSYTVPGDRTVSGGFVGATLHYAIKDRVTLDGTIEYTETSGDRSGALSGQLGLVFKF